jgi:hypothetical protein
LFKPAADITFEFTSKESRPIVEAPQEKDNKELKRSYLFIEDEPVGGNVTILAAKRIEHTGIKLDLVGRIGKVMIFSHIHSNL